VPTALDNGQRSRRELLGATRIGTAYLEQRAKKEAKRRRNPFYWGDRALRAILGIPSCT
jgi:hypothetical protein